MALFRVLPLTCFMSPHWYFDPQKWVPTFWQNLSNIGVFQFCVHFWKPFSRWEGPFCSKGAHFWTPFFDPFLRLVAALLIFGVLVFDPLFDHLLIHLFSWFWMISWSPFHFITFEYISWHLFIALVQRHYCNIWGHYMTHFMTLLWPFFTPILDQEQDPFLGPVLSL